MGAIWAITNELSGIKGIFDLMAGSGFSGKIFQIRFPNAQLLLNDLSEDCANSLIENFQNARIQNTFAHLVQSDFSADLVFIDFNNLTMMRFDDWKEVFDTVYKWNPKYYMYTDSACYGFKFVKNLTAYGVETKEQYYEKVVAPRLLKDYGWYIHRVCIFGNAALILCSKEKIKSIRFMNYSPIIYTIYDSEGLF